MFCHVSSEQVFGVHDVSSVYHVPLLLQSQGIVEYLQKRLKLNELNIAKEMKVMGESLGKRWRDLTSGYVSSLDLVHDRTHIRP
jgi:CTP synthase